MQAAVKNLSEKLRSLQKKLAVAESCTGGLIAMSVTELAGSSDIFDRGFVTYSNQSKIDMLGVSPATLEEFGAVSAQTAREMANGVIRHSLADFSISVTGIAGPAGGTAAKPVGLVYIGIGQRGGETVVFENIFSGDRQAVRMQAAVFALRRLLTIIESAN